MKDIQAIVALESEELKTIVGGEDTDPTIDKRLPVYDGWGDS